MDSECLHSCLHCSLQFRREVAAAVLATVVSIAVMMPFVVAVVALRTCPVVAVWAVAFHLESRDVAAVVPQEGVVAVLAGDVAAVVASCVPHVVCSPVGSCVSASDPVTLAVASAEAQSDLTPQVVAAVATLVAVAATAASFVASPPHPCVVVCALVVASAVAFVAVVAADALLQRCVSARGPRRGRGTAWLASG